MESIAVIGAGIAGLTAAFRLRRQGRQVTVFEATDRVGGMIHSTSEDGYLMEWGPNTIQTTTPLLEEIIGDLKLNEALVEASAAASKRYVVKGGSLVPLPGSPLQFLGTPLFSAGAKLRLLKEPFTAPRPDGDDESVADFARRRLGEEFLRYAVDPFVAGVHAGDPEELAVGHAFPRLNALEKKHGSLIRGSLALRRERKGKSEWTGPSRRMFSFRQGLSELPASMAASLGSNLRMGVAVDSIRAGEQWTIEAGRERAVFDGVVYAGPAHRLPSIEGANESTLSVMKGVRYAPIAVAYLGFRRDQIAHPLDGFGLLVPAVEHEYRILGCLFSSVLFRDRAPDGYALLTVFLGGMRHPVMLDRPDDALLDVARNDLSRLLHIDGQPAFSRIHRWHRAIPQYTRGYGRVKEAIAALENAHPGLALAGNYRRGVSVGDTMASGDEAARYLVAGSNQARP